MHDCIVLGLGGFGSSALAHLAKRGVRVLGIERFGPVHALGSSHGRTRIIRKAYFEHPDYVPLLLRAYELWSELEAESGQTLYHECGLLISGPGDGQIIPGARQAAKLHSLPLEDVPRGELAGRFPGFRIPDDHEVAFEPEAGYLLVEDCVRAHLESAERNGAETRFNEPVLSWSATDRAVEVRTATRIFTAKHLVIAGGAWASQLLADATPALRVLRKVLLWCEVDPAWSAQILRNPAFFFDLPGGSIYGFPSQDGATLKLAEHHAGGEALSDPLHVDRSLHPADTARITQFVQAHLRGVLPRVVDHAVCMYTMSPDEHFIIDQHPRHANVTIAAGFSGHGFKFTSVIGEALADLATRGTASLPIGFLGLERFRGAA